MAADADNDTPQEDEAPKKTTTRRRSPAKKAADAEAAEAAIPEPAETTASEEPATEAPAAAEAASTEPAEPEPAADGESKPAEPSNLEKAKEKFNEVDWEYRGRALLRGVMMILAAAAVGISVWIIYLLAFVHFIYTMITAEKLAAATEFSARLAVYVRELLDFICYRKNEPLFPLAPFPDLPEHEKVQERMDPGEGTDQKPL